MYHILVRIDGKWVSRGFDHPANFNRFTRAELATQYGADNVGEVFWQPFDDRTQTNISWTMQNFFDLAAEDVKDANEVQALRDAGRMDSEVNGQRLDLAYGINQLRKRRSWPAPTTPMKEARPPEEIQPLRGSMLFPERGVSDESLMFHNNMEAKEELYDPYPDRIPTPPNRHLNNNDY